VPFPESKTVSLPPTHCRSLSIQRPSQRRSYLHRRLSLSGSRPWPQPGCPLSLPIALSLSLSIATWTRRRRLSQAGVVVASSSSSLLATRPHRWPPASLAAGAASSFYSVCLHAMQVLQETLAACAMGRGGSALTQPPAAAPLSDVDALASYSSGDYQVVVPPPTVWPTR
jgi:hypothetical protein